MKALPKRKGNINGAEVASIPWAGLNESPSKKEGKSRSKDSIRGYTFGLNESPSKKEGKFDNHLVDGVVIYRPQ